MSEYDATYGSLPTEKKRRSKVTHRKGSATMAGKVTSKTMEADQDPIIPNKIAGADGAEAGPVMLDFAAKQSDRHDKDVLEKLARYSTIIEARKRLSARQRWALITGEIGAIAKSGEVPGNSYGRGYSYIKSDDIMARLRQLMSDYGLNLDICPEKLTKYPIKSKSGSEGERVRIYVTFRLVNADDKADFIEFPHWPCLSEDYGDKGDGKALTLGTKYLLIRAFMISDKDSGEADPDAVIPPEKPAGEQQYRKYERSSDFQQQRESQGQGQPQEVNTRGEKLASQPQKSMLFAVGGKNGWQPAEIKQLVLNQTNHTFDELVATSVNTIRDLLTNPKVDKQRLLDAVPTGIAPRPATPGPAAPASSRPTPAPTPTGKLKPDNDEDTPTQYDDEPYEAPWSDMSGEEFTVEIENLTGGMTYLEAVAAMGFNSTKELYGVLAAKIPAYKTAPNEKRYSMIATEVGNYFVKHPEKRRD
jgi:hypothetical protein